MIYKLKTTHILIPLLVGVVCLLIGTYFGYTLNSTNNQKQDYNLLHVKNANGTTSFIRSTDLNNDGADEIIYEPRSASWYNQTFVFKAGDYDNPLIPFCKHCKFETYASSVEFKDLNNDGLLDVKLPTVVDSSDNYKKESDVIYLLSNGDYQKQ